MRLATSWALLIGGGLAFLPAATTSSKVQSNTPPSVAVAAAPEPGQVSTNAPAEPVAPKDLSQGASDVVTLFRDGRKDNVLIFYVDNAGLDYKLSADDIVYLKAMGVSSPVIKEMMDSDRERQKAVVVQPEVDPLVPVAADPATGTSEPAPVAPENVQQSATASDKEPLMAPAVVYPDYSAYPNYYQSFDNSDDHRGRVSVSVGIGVGVGFGNGGYYRGYGGHGGHFGGRR